MVSSVLWLNPKLVSTWISSASLWKGKNQDSTTNLLRIESPKAILILQSSLRLPWLHTVVQTGITCIITGLTVIVRFSPFTCSAVLSTYMSSDVLLMPKPAGRHLCLYQVFRMSIPSKMSDSISQNSHRQLSHQTALPTQQFSSTNQRQLESQSTRWYKPFQQAPKSPLVVCQVDGMGHEPARPPFISDSQLSACNYSSQSAAGQIP